MITAILLYNLLRKQNAVERYISVICIWTLLCYIITELLSVFEKVTCKKMWACWGLCVFILFLLNILSYRGEKLSLRILILDIRKIHITLFQIIWIIFAVVMLFLAVRTVPYNYDSMTYHLPRVFHWFRNETVAHYATNIDRQVSTSGLAEFILLNVYGMLRGDDHLVNVLQCSAYLTNGVLVYCIAQKLNCSRKYCILACVLLYTTPIAFAEAFTTQADNFAALWALCFTYLLLDFLDPQKKIMWERESIFRVVLLSLCLALGYLAKSSICIGMALFALWLLIVVIKRRDNFVVILKCMLLSIGIMGVLVVPEMARNMKTFGAISSPDVRVRQLVGTLKPNYVFINFIKNFTFNMPTLWIKNSSEIIHNCVSRIAQIMHVDIADPVISDYPNFVVVPAGTLGHDQAVNPIFIWLFVICLFLFIVKNRKRAWSDIRKQYYITASIGILIFCIFIRWEPYLGRFMISYIAVMFPALSIQLEDFFEKKNKWLKYCETACLMVLFFASGITAVREFQMHGGIAFAYSRNQGYFMKQEEMFDVYEKLTEHIDYEGYKKIGLKIGYNTLEYPLLVMLNRDITVKHVNVTNDTVIYEDVGFIPDAIIVIDVGEYADELECHGQRYGIFGVYSDKVKVYQIQDLSP